VDPDLGAGLLVHDEAVLGDVLMVSNFYLFRSGGAPAGIDLAEGLRVALAVVTYRVEGVGEPALDDAPVTFDGDDLVVADIGRGRDRSATRARIPLWSLLGAAAGDGRITLHRANGSPVVVRNRSGVFASKPRPDHYRTLERWIALLAGAAAERRWRSIGVRAHAAELGLAPERSPLEAGAPGEADAPGSVAAPAVPSDHAVASAGHRAVPAAGPSEAPSVAPSMAPPAPSASPIADSLRALDALRREGLVSDAEYEAKRSEILARL
jgi:hypothetical protein